MRASLSSQWFICSIFGHSHLAVYTFLLVMRSSGKFLLIFVVLSIEALKNDLTVYHLAPSFVLSHCAPNLTQLSVVVSFIMNIHQPQIRPERAKTSS